MESQLTQISTLTATLAREASKRVFHVPSPAGGRSALSFDGKRILVPALEAEEGEEVAVLAPGGKPVVTRVIGFDAGSRFAVLELAEALPETAWQPETALPALGSLLLSLAYPSEEGPEARLNLVRIAKGEPDGEEAYIQTDGAAFPGFSGAALVSPSGGLSGIIVVDRGSNHGWALPALRAKALLETIVTKGFPSRAWLGLATIPIDLPAAWKSEAGGAEEGVMTVGVEEGSPALAAGILPGDLLLTLAGKTLASPEELRRTIAGLKLGEPSPLVLLRAGKKIETTVKPEEDPRRDGRPHHHHHHGQHTEGSWSHRHHADASKGDGAGGCGCGCAKDR